MRRSARVTGLVLSAAMGAVILAGCSGIGSDIPEPAGVPDETTSANVYYATGRSLVEESRLVDARDVYRSTLAEWLKASPKTNANIAIVQPVATPNGVELDASGVLTIDWPAGVLDFDAEPKEQLIALAGILRTMGQFPEVKKVRFTVEGRTSGTIGGKDVEAFWGGVSLKSQPFDVLRPEAADPSGESAVTTQP